MEETMELDSRVLSFMINDKLNFNMFDLCKYINNQYSSVDVYTIKKNFIQISDQNIGIINDILFSFISDRIKSVDDTVDDIDFIKDNLDVFFEVTEDESNSSFTIERSTFD